VKRLAELKDVIVEVEPVEEIVHEDNEFRKLYINIIKKVLVFVLLIIKMKLKRN
jgi:phage-related holin